jgi:hypothetical protein
MVQEDPTADASDVYDASARAASKSNKSPVIFPMVLD